MPRDSDIMIPLDTCVSTLHRSNRQSIPIPPPGKRGDIDKSGGFRRLTFSYQFRPSLASGRVGAKIPHPVRPYDIREANGRPSSRPVL